MGKMSRDKGKRGEREVAKLLKQYGYDARRGQQYCGASGDADVVGLPGVHIEVKYVECLDVKKALEQAVSDARKGDIPAVFHKQNRKPLNVIMRTQDFVKFLTGDEIFIPDLRVTIEFNSFMALYRILRE